MILQRNFFPTWFVPGLLAVLSLMPSLFIYAKVVMPIARYAAQRRRTKERRKIVRFADTDYRERSRPASGVGGSEQWRWHSFRHVYIKSSISVEATAVSIRVHFVFANGKADKTFNMFKLASISIIYPIRDYLVRVQEGGGMGASMRHSRMLDLVWFLLRNIERYSKILIKTRWWMIELEISSCFW